MTIEEIRHICLGFARVTEDIKWESHLCFCIGERIFIITSPDQSPVTASFKVDEEDFFLLTEREGFKPAPYLARYKWIAVDDISRIPAKEWKHFLRKAYELVAGKLPAKTKKQLGIT